MKYPQIPIFILGGFHEHHNFKIPNPPGVTAPYTYILGNKNTDVKTGGEIPAAGGKICGT